jgi:hypothetical protein
MSARTRIAVVVEALRTLRKRQTTKHLPWGGAVEAALRLVSMGWLACVTVVVAGRARQALNVSELL